MSHAAPLVLVAPDSFKGSFAATEVADAIAAGASAGGARVDIAPVADGGEGTMAILVAAAGGEVVRATVTGPVVGQRLSARYGLFDGGRSAIIEVAETCGLHLVAGRKRDPEAATTRGVGELMLAAQSRGARRLIVAAGGSASTDGGSGALEALRAGGGLVGARVEVLCDVTTPFEKAAIVFGAQKGASSRIIERLTHRLHHQARQLSRDPRGIAMTGAAGGLSGGLWAALGATLRAGAPWVLEAIGFDARLADADAVVSGEGRLDGQSLEGKIVGAIATRARDAGVAMHAIVGASVLTRDQIDRLCLVSMREAPTLEAMVGAGRELAMQLPADLTDSRLHNRVRGT